DPPGHRLRQALLPEGLRLGDRDGLRPRRVRPPSAGRGRGPQLRRGPADQQRPRVLRLRGGAPMSSVVTPLRRRQLQIALDVQTIPEALAAVEATADDIDVIEVGTILCLAEGMDAVRCLRAAHPMHTILADVRIAEAGSIIAGLAYDAGADWVTVVSGAARATMEAVARIAT